jgi:hypothetical protein
VNYFPDSGFVPGELFLVVVFVRTDLQQLRPVARLEKVGEEGA